MISTPLFVVGFMLTQMNFGVIWRYFAWSNQTLATVVLWTITAYLIQAGKNYWFALIPAAFMTAVVTSYILVAPEGFSVSQSVSIIAGVCFGTSLMIFTILKSISIRKRNVPLVH